MNKKIAFFDFDGTITTDDSLLDFIRFSVGNKKFFLGLLALSPVLIFFKAKIIPNYKAKQMMLSWFFKGCEKSHFSETARNYSLTHIDSIIRPAAMEKINWHKSQGHQVVVVSASLDCWLRPWCEERELELIATQLAFDEDIVSGRLLTKNCHGQEKVNRIKSMYILDEYDEIFAYGDSSGDIPMLCLASKAYYKPFR